jgi:hypothetical protein
MLLSPVRVLLAALFLPLGAQAQFSAYLTYSPTHLSSIATGTVYTATAPGGYTEATASYWSSGFGGGVTLPILHLPVVALNMDLRGSSRPGTTGSDSALFGLQLAVHPHVIPFKPYLELAGGYLDTRTVNQTNFIPGTPGVTSSQALSGTITNRYAAYEVLGGVDYPLIHFLDYRIVEIGVGQGYSFSSQNATFVTVNTGLVLHF